MEPHGQEEDEGEKTRPGDAASPQNIPESNFPPAFRPAKYATPSRKKTRSISGSRNVRVDDDAWSKEKSTVPAIASAAAQGFKEQQQQDRGGRCTAHLHDLDHENRLRQQSLRGDVQPR